MLTFVHLQDETKRRAIRNQAGTDYDTAVKNAINSALFRISREAPWRVMRRKTWFNTVGSYTSGTGFVSVVNSQTSIALTATACDFFVDNIQVGRRVKFGTDSHFYTIRTINSNTNFTIDSGYQGTSSSTTTYEILPQMEYDLPMQSGHRMFLWHEFYGFPYKMFYVPDQTFFETRVMLTFKAIPTHYRMWSEDMVISQVPTATTLSVVSTSSNDSATSLTVFGKVAGYPAFETITLTTKTTTNLFDSVERISRSTSTTGMLTVTSSVGNYTIAVIPMGGGTAGVTYNKIQLYPLPMYNQPINIHYYKDPFKLVNDGDIHELGENFNEAIVCLAVAKLKYEEGQSEGDRWLQMYTDELRSLRGTDMDKIDWYPKLLHSGSGRADIMVSRNLSYQQAGPFYGPASRR